MFRLTYVVDYETKGKIPCFLFVSSSAWSRPYIVAAKRKLISFRNI